MGVRRSLTMAISKMEGVDPVAVQTFLQQDTDSKICLGPEITSDVNPDSAKTRPTQSVEKYNPTLQGEDAGPRQSVPIGLIPVTIRLRPQLAWALKHAALERELAGKTPFTQQGIVEAALKAWLREMGFEN